MNPIWLRKEAIVILHEESLAEHGGLSGFRDVNLLDSALARPENLFHYGTPDLFDLAAEYAFGIVRNHPFIDGNKRAGFLAAATFLLINGQMLVASEADATNMTLALAAGEIGAGAYAAWLKDNVGTVPQE
ncbi:MAG: type II toxin-antitoxin system death-on-curing family toxin [Henriciella sp.]|nr:type II toxin-antitoxin system death-on-curing family toxin [Henriciella sp.]